MTTLAERIKVFYELLSSEQPPRGLGSLEAASVAAAAAIYWQQQLETMAPFKAVISAII